jgi:hypothetical protein
MIPRHYFHLSERFSAKSENTLSVPLLVLLLCSMILGIALAVNANSAGSDDPAYYVGQQTCLQSGCHDGPYLLGESFNGAESYSATVHQRSHQRPNPESVRIDRYFEHDSVVSLPIYCKTIHDTLVIQCSKSPDRSRYLVQMRLASGHSTPVMEIVYTFGGNANIQRFMVEIDGRYYVLPFQYVLPHYGERSDTGTCITAVEPEKWLEVDNEQQARTLRFIQTNSNTFRVISWDRTCSPCHATISGVEFASNGGDSSLTSTIVHRSGKPGEDSDGMSVDCESCHGPGSRHADNPTTTNILSPKRFGTSRTGTDLKLDLCNQCHSRLRSTGGTFDFAFDETGRHLYIPGTALNAYVAKGDQLSSAKIWPDSSELAHHQNGQDYMRSYAYLKHIHKDGCWSCHTVHSNGNKLPFQLNRNWYSLADGEGCLSCHGSMGALFQTPLENMTLTEIVNGRRINSHTRHSQDISQCVNCHFSKTASVSTVHLPTKPYYEFTSHHFKVIRPNLTRQFSNDANSIGQINTCAEACHRNGRGSRNFRQSDRPAPDFGIDDGTLTVWNESTDLSLADSLWYHYQQMFLPMLSADHEAGPAHAVSMLGSVLPNPAHTLATIRFEIAAPATISLEVFDMQGRFVRLLAAGHHEPGRYTVQWDLLDEADGHIAAGSYLIRLKADRQIFSRKLVIAG